MIRRNISLNATGRFVIGGPVGDSGWTGKKIIVDTYGGFARHGGGSFSVRVETFGTASLAEELIEGLIDKHFDLRLAAIICDFDLRKPIYRKLACYGHFGRPELDLPWERTDKADLLAEEAMDLKRLSKRQTGDGFHG